MAEKPSAKLEALIKQVKKTKLAITLDKIVSAIRQANLKAEKIKEPEEKNKARNEISKAAKVLKAAVKVARDTRGNTTIKAGVNVRDQVAKSSKKLEIANTISRLTVQHDKVKAYIISSKTVTFSASGKSGRGDAEFLDNLKNLKIESGEIGESLNTTLTGAKLKEWARGKTTKIKAIESKLDMIRQRAALRFDAEITKTEYQEDIRNLLLKSIATPKVIFQITNELSIFKDRILPEGASVDDIKKFVDGLKTHRDDVIKQKISGDLETAYAQKTEELRANSKEMAKYMKQFSTQILTRGKSARAVREELATIAKKFRGKKLDFKQVQEEIAEAMKKYWVVLNSWFEESGISKKEVTKAKKAGNLELLVKTARANIIERRQLEKNKGRRMATKLLAALKQTQSERTPLEETPLEETPLSAKDIIELAKEFGIRFRVNSKEIGILLRIAKNTSEANGEVSRKIETRIIRGSLKHLNALQKNNISNRDIVKLIEQMGMRRVDKDLILKIISLANRAERTKRMEIVMRHLGNIEKNQRLA